jgi:NAD(P)H-hydrate repair Nnr-like enzyme with NAD(P)H-hydrate epimerase domain
MRPVYTAAQMGAIDAAAGVPVAVLIERAGAAVARTALAMLGGGYGRRVVVIAGTGNNGADGRVAARRLAERGVLVTVVPADGAPALRRMAPDFAARGPRRSSGASRCWRSTSRAGCMPTRAWSAAGCCGPRAR